MKKMNCLKILVMLGLVLLLMCLFNTNVNVVYAVDKVNQEYLDNLINILPDKVELDISEKQAMQEHIPTSSDRLVGNKKLKDKINLIFAQNNIDIIALKEQNIEIGAWITEDLKGEISLFVSSPSGDLSSYKTINIIYNNSNNHNLEEESKIINRIENNIPKYYLMIIDKNGNRNLDEFEVVENYYSEILNDSSIILNVTSRAGDSIPFATGYTGSMQVFKNDLFCGTIRVGNELFLDKIIIPENIEDKSEDYIEYSLPIVKKALSEFKDNEITLKAGYDDFNDTYKEKLLNSNIDNFYTVCIDGSAMGIVILEKEKTTETTETEVNIEDSNTNIKIETSTKIVPEDTKLVVESIKEGTIYNTLVKVLEDNTSKFVAFDISLINNNIKVQPNGKVKLSIPIPSGYDTSRLTVYRVDENETKTEYTVKVEDNYATFETDHFSTYVLAEKANIEDNTNEHIKDETPKTGSNDIVTIVCSVLSALSVAGIAIVKKF